MKIGFIGTGNMATAMIKGILKGNICNPSQIIGSDRNKEALEKKKADLGISMTDDNKEVVLNSDIIFLSVKPQVMSSVLEEIKDAVSDEKIIVSIAAGIRLKTYEEKLGDRKIVRVMPNTPCLVGEMAAGFSPNKNVTEQEAKMIRTVLGSSGKAYQVEEDLLDAITGLSGSGPAFVARIIEWFAKAGVKNNIPEDIAYELTLKTFIGTAKLLEETKMSPEELITMVSSPNGVTIKGREVLEGSDAEKIIEETITTANKRSVELSKGI